MKKYKTKVDIIYETLLHDITNGKYKPGERLIISQISKMNEISDIPVREAIRRLESEGYVQLNANHGPVVSDFSPEHLNEIFQIKAVLEGYASRLACDVLTEKDFKELREYNEELRKAAEGDDLKRCSQLNMEFHLRMYRDIPVQELVAMIEELWRKYSITKMVFSLAPGRALNSIREHEEILELLEQKKYVEVEAAVRAHKMAAGRKMEDQLRSKIQIQE